MLLTDTYGIVPGLTTSRETYEAEFRWGSEFQGVFANGLISGSAIDSGNTPTFELRPGLLLGQQIATGKYAQYNPAATDGTEVAGAVLIEGLRMLDFSNLAVDRFYAVLVGGPVQAAKLIGLDNMARTQMAKFIFDDIFNLPGNGWFPWKRFQTKIANYTIVSTDNLSHFDNLGAAGEVDITLPPIANGLYYGFHALAAQTFKLISNEGGNLVGTTASQTSVSVANIGGGFEVYSNPAATKWIVTNLSSSTQTLTYV